MSERINVTVIIENKDEENQDGTCKEVRVSHDPNMTLMSTLLKENVISGNFCGGRGSCKRCRLQFLSEAPIPTEIERSAFTPEELRKGHRLACMARPKRDCVIRLDLTPPRQIEILTAAGDVSGKISENISDIISCSISDVTKMSENADYDVIAKRQEFIKINKCYDKIFMIAVDLGTTTIAMQLIEMNSGKAADTYCAMNPQRSYGADVLSRIHAANMGHAQELRDSVWKVIQAGIESFRNTIEQDGQHTTEEHKAEEICCMCIAGNTTMEHLLMGLSTESLGKSPFNPVEIGLQRCTLPYLSYSKEQSADKSETLQVYITPGISAFVGGDIVAGLYHCGLLNILDNLSTLNAFSALNTLDALDTFDSILNKGAAVLFIDLGTNGEMAITDGNRMIVTAAAAGSAFEGGANAAVPGSDMIAVMASLLEQGIIDETGLLAEEYFEQGIDVPIQNAKKITESTIHLTQKDIRALQMAKAAVRAGIEILYEKMGCPGLMHVYLAGGFGYYLDVNAAIAIGLLPKHMRNIVSPAGNTSLAGAFDMGRDLWTGRLEEETLSGKLQCIESINLADEDNFEALYLKYLNFPIAEA